MKAICPISGTPFRTYDALPYRVKYPHPIFTLSYAQLVAVLEDISKEETKLIESMNKELKASDFEHLTEENAQKWITSQTVEAQAERNYKNPHFRLFQAKQLTLLAFFKATNLLELEPGFHCKINPHTIEAYFWPAIESFSWICTISNQKKLERFPKYRVSRINQKFQNFSEYLSLLQSVQFNHDHMYFSRSEEERLASLQHVMFLLARRREANKIAITSGTNRLAATWAMLVTHAPDDIKEFWFEILCKPTRVITFEGVEVKGKMVRVTIQDLKELRDWLTDNLLTPRDGTDLNKIKQDDSETYFVSRHTVLSIMNKHIEMMEQGGVGYEMVNDDSLFKIQSANDKQLVEFCLQACLEEPMPPRLNYKSDILYMKAMALWRLKVRQELVRQHQAKVEEKPEVKTGANYEIL